MAIASLKAAVMTALTSGLLCSELMASSKQHNVTFLTTPTGIQAIQSVCNTTILPIFGTLFFAGVNRQPSSMPSGSPSEIPTYNPTVAKPELVTSSFIGFMVIVFLIGFLRFYPDMVSFFTAKKKLNGHKYDILVVLDDDTEAILENINHEDIAFFRRTWIQSEDQTLGWMINATAEALDKRFEVKFLDKYGLLYSGVVDEEGNKIMTEKEKIESHIHATELQIGMILRVQLARGSPLSKNTSMGSRDQSKTRLNSEFEDMSNSSEILPKRKLSRLISNAYPHSVRIAVDSAGADDHYTSDFEKRNNFKTSFRRHFFDESEEKDDDDDDQIVAPISLKPLRSISWIDMLPHEQREYLRSMEEKSEEKSDDASIDTDTYSLKYEPYREGSERDSGGVAIAVPVPRFEGDGVELSGILRDSLSLDDISQRGLTMSDWSSRKYEEKSQDINGQDEIYPLSPLKRKAGSDMKKISLMNKFSNLIAFNKPRTYIGSENMSENNRRRSLKAVIRVGPSRSYDQESRQNDNDDESEKNESEHEKSKQSHDDGESKQSDGDEGGSEEDESGHDESKQSDDDAGECKQNDSGNEESKDSDNDEGESVHSYNEEEKSIESDNEGSYTEEKDN